MTSGLVVGLMFLVGVVGEPTDRSSAEQARIADGYQKFESNLARTAEALGSKDPAQSARLKRALQASKQELVGARLRELATETEQGDLAASATRQEIALSGMRGVLAELLAETSAIDRDAEREQVQEQLRQAQELASAQRSLRQRTGEADRTSELSDAQQQLADKAAEFEQNLDNAPGEQNDEPQSSKDGLEQSASSAKESMQKAGEHLANDEKEQALAEQDSAIEQLEKSIRELGKILEEIRKHDQEKQRNDLIERLTAILEQQNDILSATVALDETPAHERDRAQEQQLIELVGKEGIIVESLAEVLEILSHEESAVAFPEAVDQARRDAVGVGTALNAGDTGRITQNLEEDVIATVGDLLASLEQSHGGEKESHESKDSSQQSKESPLVAPIAELKLIRSMQQRVNERTQDLVARQAGVDDSTRPAMVQELVDRQERIVRMTEKLAEGVTP